MKKQEAIERLEKVIKEIKEKSSDVNITQVNIKISEGSTLSSIGWFDK